MKNFLFLLPLIGLLSACGTPADRVRLKGHIKGVKQAECYVYAEGEPLSGFDTLKIDDGKFDTSLPATQTRLLHILFPNFSEISVVAEPGKTVEVEGDADHLRSCYAGGSEENELLSNFRREVADKSERETCLAAEKFIRDHIGTMAAVAVFHTYFARNEKPDLRTTQALMDELGKAQPQNATLAEITQTLQRRLKSAVGARLPRFGGTTLSGDSFSSQKLSGQPLCIVVWAAWSNESYRMIVAARKAAKKMSGRIQFVHVSLDLDAAKARERVRRDSISAPVLFDGAGPGSRIAEQLGITCIPGNILVGSDGRIRAVNVEPSRLEEELSRL